MVDCDCATKMESGTNQSDRHACLRHAGDWSDTKEMGYLRQDLLSLSNWINQVQFQQLVWSYDLCCNWVRILAIVASIWSIRLKDPNWLIKRPSTSLSFLLLWVVYVSLALMQKSCHQRSLDILIFDLSFHCVPGSASVLVYYDGGTSIFMCRLILQSAIVFGWLLLLEHVLIFVCNGWYLILCFSIVCFCVHGCGWVASQSGVCNCGGCDPETGKAEDYSPVY